MRNFCSLAFLLLLPASVLADCTCDAADQVDVSQRNIALRYKLAAIASILVAGVIGVALPTFGKKIFPALSPERNFFFIVKAFAAGVILATGFIHVLPDAFDDLSSPCLNQDPWGNFPFAGFIAMIAAIGTLMIDTYANSYFHRRSKTTTATADLETAGSDDHGTHAHTHAYGVSSDKSQLLRHRVISQVLELGIIVHSVIIGIALGASENPSTIRPLIGALTFHQLFEGMGLGGCIAQGKFKARTVATMAAFFSLTTPIGIAIGIGITNVYSETSPTALIVQGVFNSASSGILIYMALVDLLAADFMSSKVQGSWKLQAATNVSLLLGAAGMSILAKWA